MPEESKGTALGVRDTRLWIQSLVCYTFVQQKRQRKADSLCLKAQAASLLLFAGRQENNMITIKMKPSCYNCTYKAWIFKCWMVKVR